MGNGPGGLADYQALFERYDRLQGGFVREWIDHGVRHPELGYAYGGDFGEELHDGNFVCDGLLFPDRTPAPGLIEYKKVIEPVRIEAGDAAGTVRVTNRYDFADLPRLEFEFCHQVDGLPTGAHRLTVPPLATGESAEVKLPEAPDGGGAEVQWSVRAARRGRVLGRSGPRGGLGPGNGGPPRPVAGGDRCAALRRRGRDHAGAGRLRCPHRRGAHRRRCGVRDLRLDVWRATTDNDDGATWQSDTRYGPLWRELGLHRMRHRLKTVETDGDALTVRTRVAPAGREMGQRTAYRWTSDGTHVRLTVSVVPEGDWRVPLPRLGVRFGLDASSTDAVSWFGGGGEACPDTRAASKDLLWDADVEDLQTPYTRPQENGARADVRWAEIGGLRIDGDPEFWLTARPWTSEQLDAARHLTDLVPGETVWVNLDHAQHGIGSQSCGPGPLPQYVLRAEPAEFSFVFSAQRGSG